MNLSIGICVSPSTPAEFLSRQMISVYNLTGLRHTEVIICGNMSNDCFTVAEGFASTLSIKYIPYEGPLEKPGHITKKKNLIADIAFFDNLVLMHDYFLLPPAFAEHLPHKYDVYVPPIVTAEGKRGADWMINPEKLDNFLLARPDIAHHLMSVAPHENAPKYVNALNYSIKYMGYVQYISGGFISCRTEVFRDNPMNEDLYWGDAEDLCWSERIVDKYRLSTNAWNEAVRPVRCMKHNKWAVTEMPLEVVKELRDFYGI